MPAAIRLVPSSSSSRLELGPGRSRRRAGGRRRRRELEPAPFHAARATPGTLGKTEGVRRTWARRENGDPVLERADHAAPRRRAGELLVRAEPLSSLGAGTQRGAAERAELGPAERAHEAGHQAPRAGAGGPQRTHRSRSSFRSSTSRRCRRSRRRIGSRPGSS